MLITEEKVIFGGDSAKESYELYKDALQCGVPERGAFVFYDCLCTSENGPVNWGHCGVSLGDGRVIHAWDIVRIDDYLALEDLTALTGAFKNTDYPALYSYCKYTNEASIRTAESIGMQFDREYPDEANGMTHVSVIYRRT